MEPEVSSEDFEVIVHLLRAYIQSQCCVNHALTKLVFALCAACATYSVDALPYAQLFVNEATELKTHLNHEGTPIQ